MAKMTEEKRQERIRVRAYHYATQNPFATHEEAWLRSEAAENYEAHRRSMFAHKAVETKRRSGVSLNGADTKRLKNWHKFVEEHYVVLETVQEG